MFSTCDPFAIQHMPARLHVTYMPCIHQLLSTSHPNPDDDLASTWKSHDQSWLLQKTCQRLLSCTQKSHNSIYLSVTLLLKCPIKSELQMPFSSMSASKQESQFSGEGKWNGYKKQWKEIKYPKKDKVGLWLLNFYQPGEAQISFLPLGPKSCPMSFCPWKYILWGYFQIKIPLHLSILIEISGTSIIYSRNLLNKYTKWYMYISMFIE